MQLLPREMLLHVAERFRLLGEPVRLEILNLLHVNGEMNVQELVESTGQLQANVSKHLKLLAEAGMVARRKEGLFAYYSIHDPTLAGLCMIVCGQLQNNLSHSPPTHSSLQNKELAARS